ncbi:hypothetical protein [Segatella bryantii]|uniref:hypothetical protein n=1 Tax=Segatella bryantii TaxID=77095 RepID=UPI00242FD10A|nr:hypothetical protein [Segatella bryantii]
MSSIRFDFSPGSFCLEFGIKNMPAAAPNIPPPIVPYGPNTVPAAAPAFAPSKAPVAAPVTVSSSLLAVLPQYPSGAPFKLASLLSASSIANY